MSQKWSVLEPPDDAEGSIFNPREVSVKREGMTSRRAGFQDRNKLWHLFCDLTYEDEMERSCSEICFTKNKRGRKYIGKSAIQLNALKVAILAETSATWFSGLEAWRNFVIVQGLLHFLLKAELSSKNSQLRGWPKRVFGTAKKSWLKEKKIIKKWFSNCM